MEMTLEKLDIRSCRETVVITGIGSNNCVYHAVLGFHVRNYFIVVPEDCIHASRDFLPNVRIDYQDEERRMEK